MAVLVAVLLALPFALHAQKPDEMLGEEVFLREKQLLEAAETVDDPGQLFEIYNSLALLFKDNARELGYIDKMEECARELHSPEKEATAMLLRLEYYSICSDTGRLIEYAQQARKFMISHNDRRAANVEAIVIKRQIDEGRTQSALYDAQEMLARAGREKDRYSEAYAFLNIGIAYAAGDQFTEAASALEKSLSLMQGLGDAVPEIDRIRVEMELAEADYNIAEYERSLYYCGQALSRLEAYMADESTQEQRAVNYRSMHLYILCLRARNLLQSNQIEEAGACLGLAAEDIYPHIGLDGEFYNSTCAMYYRATGDLQTALDYADMCVEAFSDADLLPYYLSSLKLKTGLLADTGQWEEAYRNMEYIGNAQDSLAVDRFVMQFGELHTRYEVDKLESQKSRQRLTIIFTSLACLLLAVALVIYSVYSSRLRSRNRSLYRQIQEAKRSGDSAARALRLTSEENLSREMRLYRRLSQVMEEEHPFTDPSFGRTSLIKLLNTNEKYLADAVREGAGVTVAAYITDWRLNYSLQCIADHPSSSIEEISELAGFGAYSSFFRAFTRKYSMSPSDYKRLYFQKGSENE